MVAKALLLLAMQTPVVTANVNRTEVEYGDTLVLSIVVNARGTDWVRLSDPDLDGLEAYSSQQVSNVDRVGDEEHRRTERTLFLRATRVGAATIGSVRVQQGRQVTTTEPITVTVSGSGPVDSGSNPIVSAILRRVPDPTGTGEVSVAIIPSGDVVRIGEQLDLLVVAWFPRELRQRLRTAPTMQPPEVSGAWAYPSQMATEVVDQREFRGALYDLYAHHQTVFPLSVEGFAIERATVTYNLPLTESFMSRELRQVVQSQLPEITLSPQPAQGRGAGFSGSAADLLTMEVSVSRAAMEVGDAATLEVTLSGRGNVALWGEPAIRWPVGLNGYPAQTQVTTTRVAGRISGTKVFNYLLVPDSIGSHTVVVDRYEYFDPSRSRYRTLPQATASVVATSGRPAFTVAEQFPLLEVQSSLSLPAALARIPIWAWILLWVIAPLIALLRRLPRLLRSGGGASTGPRARTRMWNLNEEFGSVLRGLVTDADLLEGDKLEEALVAAGVEPKLASHAVRVKHRLGQANFGPDGAGDSDELKAEIDEVSRALAGEQGVSYRRRLESVVALLALLLATPLAAQELSAERLYASRAYQSAADSFAIRVTNDPTVAANWLNLGNALFHSGEDSRALAAWIRAARLSPRNRVVRGALRGASSWRPASGPFVAPVTPPEALLFAVVFWCAAWISVAARRRGTARIAFLLFLLSGGAAIGIDRIYSRPTALIIGIDTPLHEAPVGTAQRVTTLGPGDHVLVRDIRGSWALVRHRNEDGWVLSRELEHL